MRLLTTAAILAVSATLAHADTPFAGIRHHADNLRREGQQISELLKAKQPNAESIREKIASMKDDVGQLENLLAELEAAQSDFTGRNGKDWELLRQKIQLVSVYYNTKQGLVSERDLKKSQGLLRAYARNLTTRAEMLKEIADRLDR
jgi:hypothetical protein